MPRQLKHRILGKKHFAANIVKTSNIDIKNVKIRNVENRKTEKKNGSALQNSASITVFNNPEFKNLHCSVYSDFTERALTDIALKKSERTFRRIFDGTDAISVQGYDRNRKLIYWNKASEELYGYSADEALGKQLEDLIIPEPMRESVKEAVTAWMEGGSEIPSSELTLCRSDGTPVQVFSSHVMFWDQNDNPEMYCVDIDLTELKRVEAQADRNRLVLDSLFQALPDMFFLMEQDGTILDYRGGQASDLYVPPEVFLGKRMQDVLPLGASTKFEENQAIVTARGGLSTFEYVLNLPQGVKQFEARLSELPNCTQRIVVVRDMTERKWAEEKILHQAHFDSLTNLPNRFLTLDRLSQLLNEARRNHELVAVLFLDLDDFKKINDSLGHETGDKLLVESAARLLSVVRSGDTVGRLGGDEFIILLSGLLDVTDSLPVVENLLNSFRDTFTIDERELIITASVGISTYPVDGDNASKLLRNADSAMYHAKALGRNTFSYFTVDMNREVSRRLSLEEQIHGALDRGEFEVHYQLQVDATEGNMIGAEALLRWHNPILGDVSPVEFIPVAEHTGAIVPIGQFVLTEALEMTAKLRQRLGSHFRMAVNISPRQFRDPNLVNFVFNAIHQSGNSANNLELEITEGVLMSGHTYIEEALAALSNLGVSIAMDDFGTGYSSLSYLRSYPFNVLKIDRSFISDISQSSADQELIKATIAMAHVLGLKVVAEGVETEVQLSILKKLGCDYAQGYHFGKPVNAVMFLSTLKQQPS